MKIMLMTMLVFSISSMMHYCMLMFMLMLMMILFLSNHKFNMINIIMSMDMLTYIMLLLTIMSIMLIILSSSNLQKINKMIISIFVILMMIFMSKNMLHFYIMFELVLIPTMILITMNGKQPERLQASIYLIIYTVMASLPLLISIILLKNNPSFSMSNITMLKFNMSLFMMMAFLVKMPMYFFHLWLPKAHVEAPLEGSMILAAVLLKLGGYGLMRFIPLCIKSMNMMNYWIISISLIGSTATSLNCIRQKDLKSLIAYSSVSHMGFVLCSIFSMSSMGMLGALIMMIAHGLSSSALFFLTNDLYMKFHSRNILMFKNMMVTMPNITFWWFMLMAINISAPPTINTISEILMMTSLLFWNIKSMVLLFVMSLATASFSMSMFINISHNNMKLNSTFQSNQKTFLSLFIHILPLMLLLMKMEIMLIN